MACNWKHITTNEVYRIVCFALEEKDLRPLVVYKNTISGAIWTRPCHEFFDGRFEQIILPPTAMAGGSGGGM